MARGVSKRRSWPADIIAGHAESGLSVAAYCRRHAIPVSSFYFKRRKLRGRDRDGMRAANSERRRFIPVEVKPDELGGSSTTMMVSVTFPSGVVVQAPGTPELMREVFGSLLRAEGLA